MYAVIETGGKQYRVEEGRTLKVERLQAEPGAAVTLDKVLLVADGSTAKVGSPVIEGARVTATVVGHGKAKKIIAMKYKGAGPSSGIARTHPLCAYPQTAHYKGSGSSDDAANYVCR